MNYKHLHYFMQVAKTGSVMRASEQLHLTPQTISGQIQLPEPVRVVCREWKLDSLPAELALHRLDLVISDAPIPASISVQAFSHPGEGHGARAATACVVSRPLLAPQSRR